MVELGELGVAGSPAEWPPGLDVVDVLHFLGLREELGVSEDVVPHDRLLVLVLSHTTVPGTALCGTLPVYRRMT